MKQTEKDIQRKDELESLIVKKEKESEMLSHQVSSIETAISCSSGPSVGMA